MRHLHLSVFVLSCLSFLPACAGEDEEAAVDATLAIVAPTDSETVTTEPEQNVEGEFELEVPLDLAVTGFSLAAPGSCAGDPACGHVHLFIDGDLCNDEEADGTVLPYNEELWAAPFAADALYCDGVVIGPGGVVGAAGPHVLGAVLYRDDELAVFDAEGRLVSDAVEIVVEIAP